MKPNSDSRAQRRRIGWLLLGALAIAGLSSIATVLLIPTAQQAANAGPTIPPGASLTSWFENGKGGQHVLQIAKGTAPLPSVRLVGTVTSDTDCDPDAQGLNHCRNDIDLGSGRTISVINNHAMHRYPCLEPGQRLSITRLNANWVVAYDIRPQQIK